MMQGSGCRLVLEVVLEVVLAVALAVVLESPVGLLKADEVIDGIKYKSNLKEFTQSIKNRKF